MRVPLSVWLLLASIGCARPATGAAAAEPAPVLSTSAPAQAGSATGYEFTLDDKPAAPKFTRASGSDELTPGDVAYFEDFFIRLGNPGKYALFSADGGRWFRRRGVDEVELVAVVVGHEEGEGGEDDGPLVDSLTGLSPAELHGLRGVVVRSWNDDIAVALAGLDPTRSCLRLGWGVAEATADRLPSLPRDTQCLFIDESYEEDISELGNLAQLRIADLSFDYREVDLTLLAENRQLRVLGLDAEAVTKLTALARLTALRDLDLTRVKGVTGVEFARAMTELRSLSLTETEVADLGPLSQLTALRELDVAASKVSDLRPLAKLTALRELDLQWAPVASLAGIGELPLERLDIRDTRVGGEEVRRYIELHPDADVLRWWEEPFRAAVEDADRLLVTIAVLKLRKHETLVEIRDREVIAELVRGIRVVGLLPNHGRGFACDCSVRFDFYAGNVLVETLEYWDGARAMASKTMGSVDLIPASEALVDKFLAGYGYHGLVTEW